MIKKSLAALLVAAISVSAISVSSAPAQAGGYYSDDDGYYGDRNYYRDRDYDRDYYRDRDYRSDYSDRKRHKNRDTAIIAGVAGLALGAVIVGSLANQNRRQSAPVYSRPAYNDRLIYDPNY